MIELEASTSPGATGAVGTADPSKPATCTAVPPATGAAGATIFTAYRLSSSVNHLESVDEADRRWRLPNHAHVVVYEREASDRGLLTIYDCGAAQKPPKAQLLGTLESVDAPADVEPNPTGRVVTLREEAVLEESAPDRYRIVES